MAINVTEAKVRLVAETVGEDRLARFRGEMEKLASAAGNDNAFRNLAASAARLRSELDPMYGAQMRFNQAMDTANDLRRAGLITEREYAAAQQTAREKLQAHTQALFQDAAAKNAAAKGDGQMRSSMVMLGQQIGDVGVQLQMGTSAARVFAMQAGQVGYAMAGMNGILGRVGNFLAGPWGAALTVAVSTLGIFAEKLAGASKEAKGLEMASTGLSDAQGVLGQMFDLATGKITNNTEALRLNALMTITNLRAKASEQRALAATAFKSAGEESYSATFQRFLSGSAAEASGRGGNNQAAGRFAKSITATNQTAVRAQQIMGLFRDGKVSLDPKSPNYIDRLYGEAEKLDFRAIGIDKMSYIEGLRGAVSARALDASADEAAKTLGTGTLSGVFMRPKKTRTRKERENKADPFGDAMTAIGGDREQMEFQIDALNKYGERLASTKAVLVEWNIEHGKYGKLSEDQKKALMDEARAYDTTADKLKRLTAEKKQEQEIDKARIGWKRQLEEAQDEPLALTMTALAYQQLVERKRELAQIDEKVAEWEPKTAAAYREAAIAALDQRQALERLNDEKSKTFGAGQAKAIKEYGEEIGNYGQQAFEMWTNGLRKTEDAMVNFFMTGKLGFKDLVNSMIADLVRFAVRRAILAPIMTMLGALAPGGSKFGNNAMGGLKAANGAAFGMGGVRMFADGGIVTNPTLFGYGGGIGMMGEAGAEAVMPLKRLSNGKLGVMAEGGTNNVVVNVNVEGGNSQVSGDQGKAAQLGNLIAGVVRNELVAQKRPGGILAAS